MSNINSVALTGRLTRDVEQRHTAGGFCITTGSIAVNERVKSGDVWEDRPSFFAFKILGKRGESLGQYLTRGKHIGISGHLQEERWEKEGKNHSKVVIIANDIELLGGKQETSEPSYPSEEIPF